MSSSSRARRVAVLIVFLLPALLAGCDASVPNTNPGGGGSTSGPPLGSDPNASLPCEQL